MRHIMHLAEPRKPGQRGPGNWRALCTCKQLDGPERATRDEAVDDHTAHVIDALLGAPTEEDVHA
jgi:hypothetical protein